MSITSIIPVNNQNDQYGVVSGNLSEENIALLSKLGFESGGGMQCEYGKQFFYIHVPSACNNLLPELRECGLLFNLHPASLMNQNSVEAWRSEEAYCEFLYHASEPESSLRKQICSELLEVEKKLINHFRNQVESIYDESITDAGRNCHVFLPGGDWTFYQRFDQEQNALITEKVTYCSDNGDIDPETDIPPPFVSAIFDCLQSEYVANHRRTPLEIIQRQAVDKVLETWPLNEKYDQIIQRLITNDDTNYEDSVIVPHIDYELLSGRDLAKTIASNLQSTLSFLSSTFGISFDARGEAEIHSVPISSILEFPAYMSTLGQAIRAGDSQAIADRYGNLERLLPRNLAKLDSNSTPLNFP